MLFAATIMPFAPIDVPPAATACQLCAGVPGTQVAAVSCTVGTLQLTSPRSVDALADAGFRREHAVRAVDRRQVAVERLANDLGELSLGGVYS